MSTNRVEQIKESLVGLGTIPDQGYSTREIITRLIELENALLADVYEKNHAENMRPEDLTKHLAVLAEEFGLDESSTYKRFTANMNKLDFAIKTAIVGQKGEQLARSSLKPLTFDQNIKILYNVALKNGDLKTEYDAIVVAPYGMFVVEVKNWYGDVILTKGGFLTRDDGKISTNLAARMLVKESLLRECLGDLFPENYLSLLLVPENRTHLKDEYHRLQIGFGAGITNCIRAYRYRHATIAPEQVNAIIEKISANQIEHLTYCTVKCDEIIEDFALLMAQIEAASKEEVEQDKDDTIEVTVSANIEVSPDITQGVLRNVEWKRVGKLMGGLTAALIAGFVAGCVLGHKRN